MPTQDPIKKDGRPTSPPDDEVAKAPEWKDEKRELADAEIAAISGGGNVLNPPPGPPTISDPTSASPDP